MIPAPDLPLSRRTPTRWLQPDQHCQFLESCFRETGEKRGAVTMNLWAEAGKQTACALVFPSSEHNVDQ